MNGSPAADAGLAEEDVILSLNSVPTCGKGGDILQAFRTMVREQEVGSTARVEVLRSGQRLSLFAALREMPVGHHPEARHRDAGCSGPPSALETALRSKEYIPLFTSVLEGLYQRSNLIQNPGKASAEQIEALQLEEFTYLMRHPLSSGRTAGELSLRLVAAERERLPLEDMVRKSAGLLDIGLTPAQEPAECTFPTLLCRMEETIRRVESSFSNLSADERKLLSGKVLNPWENDDWDTVLGLSLKVSREELFNAFSPLLSCLNQASLSELRDDLVKRFGDRKGPVLFEASRPMGKVIVAGQDPNLYREDAALILDLGGDDVYLNNAGGTRPGMPLSLVIDWGGNDRYLSKENFSQGSGVLGGGFLVDLGGNDTFVASQGSQGAGFLGMGLLYHGSGTGSYQGRDHCQGVGQMGIGMLINRDGDDRYLGSYGGQALGLFGGAGVLIDNEGNDFYQLGGSVPDFRDPLSSTVSFGQGFGDGIRPLNGKTGIPGGIGILLDETGDDTYIADYFAQGSSYYYGIGILNDLDGNDQYIAGRYAQGAGIHSSVGVLLDRRGNDFYYTSFGVAQGMGHDYGVGFFEDDQGDDYYRGGTLVQGSSTVGSMGMFIDKEGKDRYMCEDKGQGYAEEADSMAVMMTTGPAGDLKKTPGSRVSVRLGVKSSGR